MEIAVDDVELFASRTASECGLDCRSFVDHLRGAGDFVRHIIGASRVRGCCVAVDDREHTTSGRISSGEVDCVRCEYLLEGVKIVIGRGTNVLKADDAVAGEERLNVTDDFVET